MEEAQKGKGAGKGMVSQHHVRDADADAVTENADGPVQRAQRAESRKGRRVGCGQEVTLEWPSPCTTRLYRVAYPSPCRSLAAH